MKIIEAVFAFLNNPSKFFPRLQTARQSIFRTTDHRYQRWINEFDAMKRQELEALKSMLDALSAKPTISIIPVYLDAPSRSALGAFARELKTQIYENWDLFPLGVAGPALPAATIANTISAELITRAADSADFVLPLPLNVTLPPHALACFALAIAKAPDAVILYADEDVLRSGKRSDPNFKTDWDPFFALSCNFPGLPALYRSDALKRATLQKLKSSTVDNLLHAIALGVSGITPAHQILHIPQVLCHRHQPSDWCAKEARRLLSPPAQEPGPAILDPLNGSFSSNGNRVRFSLPSPQPSVSILIPTRDRADLIRPCLSGVLSNTDYPSMEVIVIDNGTKESNALSVLSEAENDPRVRILRDGRQFNYSALNNAAAQIAHGDILVLLNNDTEVIHADWLKELVSLASRPEIGVAGAKLLYQDGRVQHAGVIFGPDEKITHQMRLATRHEPGPHGELALLRSVSGVTAACMALRRQLYLDAGGLNEKILQIAYNDIDLCRRIAAQGLAIVWTPFAELFHYESISRGPSTTPERADRQASELMAFWASNREFYETGDPFHNPQVVFTNDCVDFARPPRAHPLRFEFTERRSSAFLY